MLQHSRSCLFIFRNAKQPWLAAAVSQPRPRCRTCNHLAYYCNPFRRQAHLHYQFNKLTSSPCQDISHRISSTLLLNWTHILRCSLCFYYSWFLVLFSAGCCWCGHTFMWFMTFESRNEPDRTESCEPYLRFRPCMPFNHIGALQHASPVQARMIFQECHPPTADLR